jgi:hypothetical protein
MGARVEEAAVITAPVTLLWKGQSNLTRGTLELIMAREHMDYMNNSRGRSFIMY